MTGLGAIGRRLVEVYDAEEEGHDGFRCVCPLCHGFAHIETAPGKVECESGCEPEHVDRALRYLSLTLLPQCPHAGARADYGHARACLRCASAEQAVREAARRIEQWREEARLLAEGSGDGAETGWFPVHLTGQPPPLQPSVLDYGAGHLLTPGCVHMAYGSGESAKTWLVDIGGTQEVQKGNTILVIDFEMGAVQTLDRFRTLGLTDAQIDARVVYVNPEVSASQRDRERLIEHIRDREVTLAIIDSMGESTSMDGLNGNDDADVVAWFRASTRWILRQWPRCAVVVVDHLPKDQQDAPFPIGSQRKRAFPHVLLSVRNVEPFSRTKRGHSVVTVRKSRDGRLPSGEQVARIEGGPEGVRLVPATVDDLKAFRTARMRRQISHFLVQHTASGISAIRHAVTGKNTEVSEVVVEMVNDGELRNDGGHYSVVGPESVGEVVVDLS